MGTLRRYIERIDRDAGLMGPSLGYARSIGSRYRQRGRLQAGSKARGVVDPYRVTESAGRETTGVSWTGSS